MKKGQHRHDAGGAKLARVERSLRVAPLADPHEEGPDDRHHDADARNHQWQQHRGERLHATHSFERRDERGAEHHRADDRPDEALEQVGSHAGDVADIVTHVVGDRGRVTRIIFGNALVDLARQVRPHVRRLGVDTAAHAREQGNR